MYFESYLSQELSTTKKYIFINFCSLFQGLLEVHSIPVNKDTCACERRKFTRRGRSQCRCVKPQCKDKLLNPDGICEDRRRCRSRQYNMKRFPFC